MSTNESFRGFAWFGGRTRFAFGVLVVLGLFAARAPASVLSVSGPSSALPTAVNAAVDGDTLLVSSGTYDGFTLDGKGLTIVADTGAAVTVASVTIIRNIPTGHDTVISGIHFNSGLQVQSCACAVRLQSVVAEAQFASGYPGLSLATDADVALVRCTLRGVNGYSVTHTDATDGVGAHVSNVALYDSLLQGGGGSTSVGYDFATAGGDGLDATDSIVMASNCQFLGGGGGSGRYYACSGASGGDGIRCQGTGSVPAACYLRDCSEQGGIGGQASSSPFGPCQNGANGLPLDFSATLVVTFPAAHRELEAQCPVRENTALTLVFRGVAGDRVGLIDSASTRFQLSTAFQGVILYGTSARSTRMGTIPAGGTLNVTLRVAELGPGIEARTRFLQALFVDSAGAATLGSPEQLVVLDSAF